MSLNFPTKEEIKLGRPPLDEVICQVKFAPVLRIAKELPIEFQESIRDRFPGLNIEQGVLVQIPGFGSTQQPVIDPTPKIYRFISLDGKTNVSLATDFFALSTKKYTHWQNFKRDFAVIYQKVEEIFRPGFVNRIGLRFVNRFTLRNTGSKDINELLDLFRPELTCLIRADAWRTPIELLSQIQLEDGKAKLAIRTGFGKEKNEPFFVLDFDYYEEGQKSADGVVRSIEEYHSRIYDAFRWCLLDNSLNRFSPLKGGTGS